MEPPRQNPSDALCAEIIAQGRRESDEIRRRAEAEVSSLKAAANSEAERIRRETLEAARAKAARRKETILTTVTVERRRMYSARVETLLETVRHEIQNRLAIANSQNRETIIALAADAICRMPEEVLVLEIFGDGVPKDTAGLAEEIRRRTGRSGLKLEIATNASPAGSGVIIRDVARTQLWDNRLSSRLERFWPELRRQIAAFEGLDGKNNTAEGQV